ncbi:MAG: GYD domain-containing protein [Acidobacteriota bacterium]
MPTYISLVRWTQQGVSNIKDSPRRLDAGRQAFSEIGVQIKQVHMTMGRYDLIMVMEAPSDDAVATALLSLASQGNVQTETLKAWSEDEYRQIVGSI